MTVPPPTSVCAAVGPKVKAPPRADTSNTALEATLIKGEVRDPLPLKASVPLLMSVLPE